MAGVYFFIPRDKLNNAVECGIKLSEYYRRELELAPGEGSRRALKAYLNPRDDESRMKDPSFACLRLNVDPAYCRVGDGALYGMGRSNPLFQARYLSRLIPLSDYRFGTFRQPECLVFTSILPESIETMGKVMDIPVLYESSEALYLSNVIEKQSENGDGGNLLLYAFCYYMEKQGVMTKYEDKSAALSLFMDKATQSYYILKNPQQNSEVELSS